MASDFALRQQEAARRPDPADLDAWPEIGRLPGRLLPVVELLQWEIHVARSRGWPTDRLVQLRDGVQMARDALIELIDLSPLERWRLLHPYRRQAKNTAGAVADLSPDTGFVCGNPQCVPFDADRRELHWRRWGIQR